MQDTLKEYLIENLGKKINYRIMKLFLKHKFNMSKELSDGSIRNILKSIGFSR